MQALRPLTVFPCYAAADREIAKSMADFLERGSDVRVFLAEGEMRPGTDLVAMAREGRMADVVVVLFSRESWKSRTPRAEWEGAFVTEPEEEGVRIAFVNCDDSIVPKILAPQFTTKQFRELKRWIRGHAPASGRAAGELDLLGIAVADRPGMEFAESAELAASFAREFRQDFDGVFTLQCGNRSLAGLAGDLAAQVGLRLEGPLAEALERLREFCESRRFLVVLEAVPEMVPYELVFGGRCSTVATADVSEAVAPDEIREIQALVADPASPYEEVAAAARRGRRLLREAGRIAELHELMQQWHAAAADEEDRAGLDESAREQIWILETWGRAEEAHSLDYERAARFDDQMLLPFA